MKKSDLFISWGKYLQDCKLIHGSAGNLSFRDGKVIYVTKSGSFLGRLSDEQVVSFNLEEKIPKDATVEAVVHREVYLNSDAKCVVHTHPLYVVTSTINTDNKYFTALDEEGITYFGGIVPIVDAKSGTADLAKKVASVLSKSDAVIVRGHGIFTKGDSFEKAVNINTSIEHSANIVYLMNNLKR